MVLESIGEVASELANELEAVLLYDLDCSESDTSESVLLTSSQAMERRTG